MNDNVKKIILDTIKKYNYSSIILFGSELETIIKIIVTIKDVLSVQKYNFKGGKFMNEYRTHNCGELRIENVGEKCKLAGWVQRIRNLGAMKFIDLRDQFGIHK